jgi:hypothetical protein
VPAQIFSIGTYLVFDFSRCPGVQIPFVDTAGYIPSVGYIREPRKILGMWQLPPQMVHLW